MNKVQKAPDVITGIFVDTSCGLMVKFNHGGHRRATDEEKRKMLAAIRTSPRQIVCEEWQRLVKEYELRPGSTSEIVVSRILNRLDEET